MMCKASGMPRMRTVAIWMFVVAGCGLAWIGWLVWPDWLTCTSGAWCP